MRQLIWKRCPSILQVEFNGKRGLDGHLRPLPELKRLLQRVEKTIHQAPDAVRYAMNNFIIAVGCCVKPLMDFALQIGEKVGPVKADMGNNNCQVFSAADYIRKVEKRGAIGKKRKTAKC